MIRAALFIITLLFIGASQATDVLIDKKASPLELDVSGYTTDNFNPTLDNGRRASLVGLSAQGKLVNINDVLSLQAKYAANYQEAKLDSTTLTKTKNFLSTELGLLARAYLQKEWYVDAGINYAKKDELLGTGISKLRKNVTSADQQTNTTAFAGITYGSDTANRNISLTYTQSNIEYANINNYSSLFSFTQQTLAANVKFKLSSATHFIFFVEHQQDNYDAISRDDSAMQRIMAGMDWQPSGSSTITALVGKYQRSPDLADKTSGLTWQLSYQYNPRDDFKMQLSSTQSSIAGESESSTNSVKQQWQLQADYFYNSLWNYGVNVLSSQTEYKESLGKRTFDETFVKLFMNYQHRKYSGAQLYIGHRSAKESTNIIDYQQNEVGISWHSKF